MSDAASSFPEVARYYPEAILPSFSNLRPMPSRGHVVAFDIETVGVDLDAVALDEVLAVRDEHKADHRRYVHDPRTFALTLSLLDDQDREPYWPSVERNLSSTHELRAQALKAWKSPKKLTGFGLRRAGAAWSLATMNPLITIHGDVASLCGLLPGTLRLGEHLVDRLS